MKKHIFCIILIIIASLSIFAATENNTESDSIQKPSFDLPDIVIQSQDRSKTSILEKEITENYLEEIEYQKDIPTSKKINIEVLKDGSNLEAESFELETEKQPRDFASINQLDLLIGNIYPLSYSFISGKNIDERHNYLFKISRTVMSEYVKHFASNLDNISLDYNYNIKENERLSLETQYIRKEMQLPSPNNQNRGRNTNTFLPVNLIYENKLNQNDNFIANAKFESLQNEIPDQKKSLTSYEIGLNYQSRIQKKLDLLTDANINNKVSKLGLGLAVEKELLHLSGYLNLNFYQSNLENVEKVSFFTPELGIRYDANKDTYVSLAYKPKMVEINYQDLYLSQDYTEYNKELKAQINFFYLEAEAYRKINDKLSSKVLFGFGTAKNAIGHLDLNQNGFIEPANLGYADLFLGKIDLSYQANDKLSYLLSYTYENNKLKNKSIPLKPISSLIGKAIYEDQDNDLLAELAIKYIGYRRDPLDLQNKLSEYLTSDFNIAKFFSKNFRVMLNLENIFNVKYQNRGDLDAIPFSAQLGFSFYF